MAGMLPGVEAARRRRVHHTLLHPLPSSPSSSSSSRRSSFSLFSPNSSTSFAPQERSSTTYQDNNNNNNDKKLAPLAREAKLRLNHKLRAHYQPLFTRKNDDDLSEEITKIINNSVRNELRTQVYGSSTKKKGGKRLIGWAKLGRKSGRDEEEEEGEEECAVCLDEYKVGENLVILPCSHRFHSKCLLPWLHTNPHCPCCRISILPL